VNIRALASTTLAATLLLGTAGCGIFVDSATLKPYSASDGLNVDVGGLQLRNVLVITDESGDASSNALRPLGVLAQHEDGLAEGGGLLLDPAGV
jgi:hypothetical protein